MIRDDRAHPVPVIAIDGPGGSGKGTVASLLARQLGWHLLDSGALYRLVALAAMNRGVALDRKDDLARIASELDAEFRNGPAGVRILLEGEPVDDVLRTEEVGEMASGVAAIGAVREALTERQRAYRQPPGLVADGRDMGQSFSPTPA